MEHQSNRKGKRTYNKISYESRQDLIQYVVKEKCSIVEAGQVLGINESTAKLIISNYRKNGTIFRRKNEVSEDTRPRNQRRPVRKQVSESKAPEIPEPLLVKPEVGIPDLVMPFQPSFQLYQNLYAMSWFLQHQGLGFYSPS